MEIPEGSKMERSRDVGGAGGCSKQSSKRSYDTKKKRFAGSKPKQKIWSFPKNELRKTSNVGGYRLLDVNILEDMEASLSCSGIF